MKAHACSSQFRVAGVDCGLSELGVLGADFAVSEIRFLDHATRHRDRRERSQRWQYVSAAFDGECD